MLLEAALLLVQSIACIAQEVQNDLLDLVWVPGDIRQSVRKIRL